MNVGHFKIGGIPRHDCHSMNKRGRGYEGVAFGAGVGNMKAGTNEIAFYYP